MDRSNDPEYRKELRDNLLVTIGSRAAYMDIMGHITMLYGSDGEDELAKFSALLADRYIQEKPECGFDEYIETALMKRFPREEPQIVHKRNISPIPRKGTRPKVRRDNLSRQFRRSILSKGATPLPFRKEMP